MIVSDIRVASGPDCWDLRATIRPASPAAGTHEAYIRVPGFLPPPPATGDPFLAGFLLACMFDHEDLRIEAPVSRKLLSSAELIQQTYASWFPDMLQRIEIQPGDIYDDAAADSGQGTAACFSGGVDSCYTLLSRDAELSHLLCVRGFNDFSRNDQRWRSTLAHCQAIADSHSKTLVAAESNIRLFIDKSNPVWGRRCRKFSFWVKMGHGGFLAAVALCLRQAVGRLIVPSTHCTANLHPIGTHPEVDPLWSTADLAIEHDSCEIDRLRKVLKIAESRVAVANLNVCFSPSADGTNCCRCEKCLRTMTSLRVAGVLDQARTFPEPLDLRRLRAVRLPTIWTSIYYREILELARQAGDTEVAESVRVVVDRRCAARRLYARTVERLIVRLERRNEPQA